MNIEFDPNKSARNFRERNLPFKRAEAFDFESAVYCEDTRSDYPERRFIALGYLEGRLHVLVFSQVPGGIRVISFRKANKREVKRYEQQKAND